MPWSYRIIKKDDHYFLHEAYMNEDGVVHSITEDPIDFMGDSPEEIRGSLKMALKDCNLEPINYEDI